MSPHGKLKKQITEISHCYLIKWYKSCHLFVLQLMFKIIFLLLTFALSV